MAHIFMYDYAKHKHSIYALEVRNEKGELLGYRPKVYRSDAKKGGVSECISDKYNDLKYKVFSTERICRDYTVDYFIALKDKMF